MTPIDQNQRKTVNRTLCTKVALGIAGLTVIVGALLLGTGIGYASSPVQRGAACSKPGEVRENRDGVRYICDERPGDGGCPRWHAYRPQPGPWPSRSTLPCAKCSPSGSPAPSPSASPSSSPSNSATAAASPQPSLTPAGNVLPVTGTPDVLRLIGVAFGLIATGAAVLAVRAILIRRRTT